MIRNVCVFGPTKMRFMQTEWVLQTKNRSELAKNQFSVALVSTKFNYHFLHHDKRTMKA